MPDLLTLAAEVLSRTGADRLTVERGGVRVCVERSGPSEVAARPEGLAGGARWLSETESNVLGVLTPAWQTAAELAEATGEACSTHFRSVLANMRERGLMEGSNSGYRLWPAHEGGNHA